mgnify:CR=1 FL=1
MGVVEIHVKDQYGKQVYHPLNQTAHLFAQMAGTKTLTYEALAIIMKLGYEIRYTHGHVFI